MHSVLVIDDEPVVADDARDDGWIVPAIARREADSAEEAL